MLPRMWTAKIGAGYAGPAVANGQVFVTDRLADQNLERVLCFDAKTGKELWKHEYEARYSISYPLGPRATPTVDGDRVYTLGAVGHMFCFDTATGNIIWQKHLPTDFGTQLPQWGTAGAPLVDGDQLIVLAGGKPNALVVSFDKKTGEERWRALDAKEPGYCPPVMLEFAGRRQLIIWHPEALVGLDPTNGNELWQVPFPVQSGLSIPTPRKLGNRLFITSFYNGPLMLDMGADGVSPRELWRIGRQKQRAAQRQPARHHVHAHRDGGLHLRRRQLWRDALPRYQDRQNIVGNARRDRPRPLVERVSGAPGRPHDHLQ